MPKQWEVWDQFLFSYLEVSMASTEVRTKVFSSTLLIVIAVIDLKGETSEVYVYRTDVVSSKFF